LREKKMKANYYIASMVSIVIGIIIYFFISIIAIIGLFLLILGTLFLIVFIDFDLENTCNCNSVIPYNSKFCPNCGFRYKRKRAKKKSIILEFILEMLGEFWVPVMLSLGMIWVYLVVNTEGTIFIITLGLGVIVMIFIYIGIEGIPSGGGEKIWVGEKEATMTERYIKKYKDGKPHLFKEDFPWDNNLGELHKNFDGSEETRNILGDDYKIGAKEFLREDRDFIKKDENEQGVLKEPDLFQSIVGDKHLTYEAKKEKNG
jgi:predicted nucleic acid-binding Zn ribbon protein